MKMISVAIPTYEMKGLGEKFLRQSFDALTHQTFKDFEVVISDHSKSDEIKNLCEEYRERLDIKYFRNAEKIGNSPANTNNAIRHATGKLIKLLFQDDFLASDRALEIIAGNFNLNRDHWIVTACSHTRDGVTFFRPFHPRYNDKIHLGNNTISSPSVLAIRNEKPLFFDENLVWAMDCDYYKRCHEAYGDPKITDEILVVNRVGDHQISNTKASDDARDKEFLYILNKYKEKWTNLRMAKRKTYRILRNIKALIRAKK